VGEVWTLNSPTVTALVMYEPVGSKYIFLKFGGGDCWQNRYTTDLLRLFVFFFNKTYCTYINIDQSNSSVEKAGLLGSMPMRMLKADKTGRMTGLILAEAIAEDVALGLIPCYVVATLGTTGICAFDCLEELGPICKENNIWLHVDAAYAGKRAFVAGYQH